MAEKLESKNPWQVQRPAGNEAPQEKDILSVQLVGLVAVKDVCDDKPAKRKIENYIEIQLYIEMHMYKSRVSITNIEGLVKKEM